MSEEKRLKNAYSRGVSVACEKGIESASHYFGLIAVKDAVLDDVADEIERLRVAMIFIMQDVDGFVGVSRDRYDFASQVADERGITGAIPVECELEGFLRMIEQANTGGNE